MYSHVESTLVIESIKDDGIRVNRRTSSYVLDSSNKLIENPQIIQTLSEYGKIISVSPSGRFCLLLKREADGMAVVDCTSLEAQSQFSFTSDFPVCNVNNPFASFSWDEDTSCILSFLFRFMMSRYSAMDCDSPGLASFTHQFTWFSGKRAFHSHIYLYNYKTNQVRRIANCLPGFSFGQPAWIDSSSFLTIGWKEQPYHDTFDACSTLPSALFLFSLHSSAMTQIPTSVVFSHPADF